MNGAAEIGNVAIIGAGRMGQGLALALSQRGRKPSVFGRDWDPAAVRAANLLLLAVPDDAISTVASNLASRDAVDGHQAVLHLSGLLDRSALDPLVPSGAALGSFHPLQSIADPQMAPERLAGAYAGIEGDERALKAAEALAGTLGMMAVRIPSSAKPAYHAAAAIVSNYTVTLVDVAQRIVREAGLQPDLAAKLYLPLLRGTVDNLFATGPEAALTGPVRRGDLETIKAHLAALNPQHRDLYRHLAGAALRLAGKTTADPAKLDQLKQLLASYT